MVEFEVRKLFDCHIPLCIVCALPYGEKFSRDKIFMDFAVGIAVVQDNNQF